MKKLLFLSLVILLNLNLSANQVNNSVAVKVATNFYYDALNITPATKDTPLVTATENYFTGHKLTYYIVNFSNKGYVIVSADDEFYPVTAYSDENNLTTADMPPAMRWWLDNQAADSEKSSARAVKYAISVSQAWQKYISGNISKSKGNTIVVEPLLTCKWNQDGGYNFHCPLHSAGPGGRCYAGCVATAMSQIMYYYKYPEHGIGSHSYSHVFYGILSVNFAETTYDWNAMTNSLNNSSKESISTLIYHCGVSVDMNYSPLGSGANSESVAEALISHFNYSNRLKYLDKSDYDNTQWSQMLIDNLQMQQPVYYSGAGSSGGHAWVCDGVKDSSYFHFNWGWSGYGNGYFHLSNLNSGNGDFTSGQAAVMNIAPYFYPYCLGNKEFTVGYKTFNDGSNFSYYWNNTDCEWLIAPDSAEQISLSFNLFATEQGHDILSIYDGADASAPLIGQYSGHSSPPPITSTGNKLYLRFTTDSSVQDQGWTATYSTATAAISENDNNYQLNISPNPASGIVNINLPNTLKEPSVTLFSITGENFKNIAVKQNKKTLSLDVSAFPSGFYLIRIISSDKTYTAKILIQH